MPSYAKARESYGLPKIKKFKDLTTNTELIKVLNQLYYSPLDPRLDSYIGGLAEKHVQGGTVGELFAAAIEDQFTRLRDGDRFWFENPGVITDDELREIKSTRLMNVIIRNTNITSSERLDPMVSLI